MIKESILVLVGLSFFVNASDFYYQDGKKVEVVKVQEKLNNSSDISYYKTSTGHMIGVKNDALVECNEGVDCLKVLSKYETTSIISLTDTIYKVEISKDKNIFKFTQKLYDNANVKIAHPNLRKKRVRR